MSWQTVTRAIDAILIRLERIKTFSDDPACVMRLSIAPCPRELLFADGTHVAKGERIGQIHFWNQRLPRIPPEGPNMGWGLAFYRAISHSFACLAAYVRDNPALDGLKAFGSELSWAGAYDLKLMVNAAKRFGIEIFQSEEPHGLWARTWKHWENLYGLALVRAYNPGSLQQRSKAWQMRRDQLWISRQALFDKYLSKSEKIVH